MRFVYVLRSARYPKRTYIGLTYRFRKRLADHNAGLCRSTSRFRPWNKLVVIQFEFDSAAADFERYLKSGSGTAFLRRHFIPAPAHWTS